jgi:hypothetical protein
MLRLSAIALALLVLGGCSMMPYYPQVKALADQGIDTAIEDRQDVNNKKAQVIKALSGEVTRGAMLREFNNDEQCAIDTLILGQKPDWCTGDEDLAAAIEKLADRVQ